MFVNICFLQCNVRQFGAMSDTMEQCQTLWCNVRHYGPMSDTSVPYQTKWTNVRHFGPMKCVVRDWTNGDETLDS